MRRHVQSLLVRAPTIYPVSACWVAGVLALVAVSAGWIGLGVGITGFAGACVLILLAVTYRQVAIVRNDIGVVHDLVNSQRTAMAERIDALIAALTIAGVPVPVDPEQAKVTLAMQGAQREKQERRSHDPSQQ